MMFSKAASALLLLATLTHTRAQNTTTTCIPMADSFSLHWVDNCSFSEFLIRLEEEMYRENPECAHSVEVELEMLLGVTFAEAKEIISSDCMNKYDTQATMAWKDVTQKLSSEPLFDQIYFDGGGVWNEQYQTSVENRVPYIPGEPAHVLRYDASRVDDVYESYAQEMKIEYPDQEVTNFDNCPLRSAMCCWPSDRQANDNNGNCNTPYDSKCVDADPGDNTNLCYVDMERNKNAAATNGGFAIFPGDGSSGEGPIHCHGMAWANDSYDTSARYKGNNMFYVSMYDHLYQRGYVRNIPGAPMCGCIDTMPVVTRADCTEIVAEELWVAAYTPATSTEPASFDLHLDPENGIQIRFNACKGADNNNNDLQAYYKRLMREGKATMSEYAYVKQTLVGNGNCNSRTKDFMASMGFGGSL